MFDRGRSILSAMRQPDARAHLLRSIRSYHAQPEAQCPCCGFVGRFESFGLRLRMGANCPRCQSKERHRLFSLALRDGFLNFANCEVLHFAPEMVVEDIVRTNGASCVVTADITPERAELCLDIESMDLPDESFDRIICSHVLEHVDDEKALAEMRRVLRSGGYAIIMIPMVEGWAETYEDKQVESASDRELYFGQDDHVRFYGSDFRGRVEQADLWLSEFTADGKSSPRFGLQRGEKVFKAEKNPVFG